jgi:membrane protein YdbS with pleckstrin-like domain
MTGTNSKGDAKVTVLHPSWLNYSGHFLLLVVFVAGAIVCFLNQRAILTVVGYVLLLIALLVLIHALLRRLSHRFTISSDAVSSRAGIGGRTEKEIRISDIRQVEVRQSVGQRIFGLGNVLFASAATGGIEVTFEGVRDPTGVKQKVNALRDALTVADKKRCPQCGEFIWKGARVCPHCHLTFALEQEGQ